MEEEKDSKTIEISQVITVREFSAKMELPPVKVITELMKNGLMVSINESIDFDTAVIIGDELGFEIKQIKGEKKQLVFSDEQKKDLKPRPPVVCVLGHVDHGKTKLLDAIRKADIISTESGGITQHIGAYQTVWQTKDGKKFPITFLDTPGHEAFSALRAHGANITDIVILVVAADDGVMPQTKEAISHAKAAGVPIIVAINKIDKPQADIERAKRQLADLDLVAEEWGGKTIFVPISAKEGKNIDHLLDVIILTSQMEELKALDQGPARGVVIESHMQQGIGPVAAVLVQNGKLKIADALVVGSVYGKVRVMEDFRGKRITEAMPSTPVKIAGLSDLPSFGDIFEVVQDEKIARNIIANKSVRIKKFGLAEASNEIKEGKTTTLNIILKADTQSSLTAIKNSLEGVGDDQVKIKTIFEGVGDISESDTNMAIASRAVLIGFKVKISSAVKKLADDKGIKISLYDIIYNLIDDLSAVLQGLIEPEIIDILVGKLEVLKVFYSDKGRKVIGGRVIDGKIQKGVKAHLYHSGEIHGEGKIKSLQLGKNPVNDVDRGFECGLEIETSTAIKTGDLVEAYTQEEKLKKISK